MCHQRWCKKVSSFCINELVWELLKRKGVCVCVCGLSAVSMTACRGCSPGGIPNQPQCPYPPCRKPCGPVGLPQAEASVGQRGQSHHV